MFERTCDLLKNLKKRFVISVRLLCFSSFCFFSVCCVVSVLQHTKDKTLVKLAKKG